MFELIQHIEYLLFNNDCVIVPLVGGFVTHYVPASYSEKDKQFLPPYRSVGFNPQLTINDGLLVQSYMQVHDTSYPETLRLVENDVRELKNILQTTGKCEIGSVGSLVLRLNGVYEFVPCKLGLPSPDLYGLDTVSLPLLSDEVLEKVENKDKDNSEINLDKTSTKGNTYTIRINRTVANLLVAAIAAFAFYFVWPNDLYPSANNNVHEASIISNFMFGSTSTKTIQQDSTKIAQTSTKLPQEQVSKNIEPQQNLSLETEKGTYSIVLASAIKITNAHEFVAKLKSEGITDVFVYSSGTMTRVLYSHYKTEEQAKEALSKLHEKDLFRDSWVYSLK